MATYGIKGNTGEAQLGGATRAAGLNKLRQLDESGARANLEGLQASLRTTNGSLKHGVLKLVNSSSKAGQMGFARKNGLDRWFSFKSTFKNTSDALKILLERSGVAADRATALLNQYSGKSGQIKYKNLDQLLTTAFSELNDAKLFASAAISVQTLAAETVHGVFSLSQENLADAGERIEGHKREPDGESARKYYAGVNERLQLADRVLYRLEDTNPFEWSDTHFEIFGRLSTLLSKAPASEKEAITGLQARYERFRDSDYPGAFKLRELERSLDTLAPSFLGPNQPSLSDAISMLEGIDKLPNNPQSYSALDKKSFLRQHTAAVMRAVHLVMTGDGVAPAFRNLASDTQKTLLDTCSPLVSLREENSVLELAAHSLVAKLADPDPAGLYWMGLGLDHQLSNGNGRFNEVALGEKVVLFLHCVDKVRTQGLESPGLEEQSARIRRAYESHPDIQAAKDFMENQLYLDQPVYYLPMSLKGYGPVDRLIVCDASQLESWITGNPVPSKDSVNVLRMQNGAILQEPGQANVESDRYEGISSVAIFAKGQAKVYPRFIQPAIDYILGEGREDTAGLNELFDAGMRGEKDRNLTETAVRNKLSPVFEAIWGDRVIPDLPATWDEVEILDQDDHFEGLKKKMPVELGSTPEDFSKFLFNLSSVVTKLGSAEVWGDEGSSVSSLRLYGYLLMKEAFRRTPDLLESERRIGLESGYKDASLCAQILSNRQMEAGHAIDSAAFKRTVPAALTRH